MVEQKATDITWHHADLTAADRASRMGHKGAVLWFTGLSGSGKSTLAHAVESALYARGAHTYVLDGDNIRHGLNKDLGFSPADREDNIRRIGEVARLFADAGLIALTAFISPSIRDRKIARDLCPAGQFLEVYCECALDVCEQRDPKGLYKKARAGEIKQFTGIDAPYEPPPTPEIAVNTGTTPLPECAQRVLQQLEERGIL